MQALAEEAGVSEDELSEEQLKQIAGGALTLTSLTVVSSLLGFLAG